MKHNDFRVSKVIITDHAFQRAKERIEFNFKTELAQIILQSEIKEFINEDYYYGQDKNCHLFSLPYNYWKNPKKLILIRCLFKNNEALIITFQEKRI